MFRKRRGLPRRARRTNTCLPISENRSNPTTGPRSNRNRWLYLEKSSVLSDHGGTLRPAEPNQFQPFPDPLPELSLTSIILNAELACQTIRPEQRNPLCVPCLEAAPRKPCIEVETAGVIRKRANHLRIDRYWVVP